MVVKKFEDFFFFFHFFYDFKQHSLEQINWKRASLPQATAILSENDLQPTIECTHSLQRVTFIILQSPQKSFEDLPTKCELKSQRMSLISKVYMTALLTAKLFSQLFCIIVLR